MDGFRIEDLISIEFLSLSHNKIMNLAGISKIPTIIDLNINNNYIEDLTPLMECTKLKKLFASNNNIKNINTLKNLTNLNVLTVFNNNINQFKPTLEVLSLLPNLEELEMAENKITRKFKFYNVE